MRLGVKNKSRNGRWGSKRVFIFIFFYFFNTDNRSILHLCMNEHQALASRRIHYDIPIRAMAFYIWNELNNTESFTPACHKVLVQRINCPDVVHHKRSGTCPHTSYYYIYLISTAGAGPQIGHSQHLPQHVPQTNQLVVSEPPSRMSCWSFSSCTISWYRNRVAHASGVRPFRKRSYPEL